MPAWGIGAAVLAILAMLAAPAVVNATAPTVEPYVRPTDAFSDPTPTAEAPQTALFIGDSYTAGAGGDGTRWTALASEQLGWVEVNEGRGGTGYVQSAGPEGCGLEYCPTYAEVIGAVETDPNVVVISGGRNDGAPENYASSVVAVIEAAKSRWPEARIIVTSPLWDDDPTPDWFPATVDAVRSAAEATGVEFADLGQPLAGRADLLSPDSIHPNPAGYEAITAAFVAAIA